MRNIEPVSIVSKLSKNIDYTHSINHYLSHIDYHIPTHTERKVYAVLTIT